MHSPARVRIPPLCPAMIAFWTIGVLLGVVPIAWGQTQGQGVEAAGRPISAIHILGLKEVPEQLVRNQIRSKTGEPYNPETVKQDIVRITHLGRFGQVLAKVTPQSDGSVALTFVVEEQPLLTDVRITGNQAINTHKLLDQVQLRAGDPADAYLIEQGRQRIVKAYQDKGYFVVSVTVDQPLLKASHILVYEVREGPKVRIEHIAFQGNHALGDKTLQNKIQSKAYFPVFESGVLNREQLELDADSIRQDYQQHGYLDAQVGRRIDLSPDQKHAVVTFLIDEGKQYTIDKIEIKGATVFPQAQIINDLAIARGDIYSQDRIDQSQDAILNLYGRLGYIETTVKVSRLFHTHAPEADLLFTIDEGRSSKVGTISVRGNEVTQSRTILREVRGLEPGRPFTRQGIEKTRQRLTESPLFSQAHVTVLGQPDDAVRDVLIDVTEQNTGSILFGAGVSSDAGVIGAIQLTQRNFDITNWPNSVDDLFDGDAFRGAGQLFSLSLQPGTETSRYSVNFHDPYMFETDYFLDASMFYFERDRDDYDERRLGGGLGVGHRFGDVWSASVRARAYQVKIGGIEPDAPTDVFDVKGKSIVTGLGFDVQRDTTDSSLFPTRGNHLDVGVEQVGAMAGDYDFTRATASFQQFWTIDKDFLGRASVLRFHVDAGYIFQDDAPVFERFYAGGHRSFRGFDYRGVGPRGIRADTGTPSENSVGGDWEFLTGLQYNFPLYKDTLRGVIFTDMGTVRKDIGFDHWRVSIGAGIRVKLPFLGQAPIAVDFAVPLAKEDGDQTQLISFDLALPFR